MRRALLVSLRMAVVTIVITGVIYPLVVWGVGAVLFPKQAAGSLVTGANGQVIGSALIAQPFTAESTSTRVPRRLGRMATMRCRRASATSVRPARCWSRRSRRVWPTQREGAKGDVPVDMVTASASGLDPDITPDNAALQVERVARARG